MGLLKGEEYSFLRKFDKAQKYFRYAVRASLRDIYNKTIYGPEAPRYAEKIWVDPFDLLDLLDGLGDSYSGKVIRSSWPPLNRPITKSLEMGKIRCCFQHWVEGISWERTGIYELLEEYISRHPKHCFDDCTSRSNLVQRYEKLDLIFQEVKKQGNIKANNEIDTWCFREKDGIYVHVGPGGHLFFGGGGCHRLAMALILGFHCIPAKIGCVHISSIPSLTHLRQKD